MNCRICGSSKINTRNQVYVSMKDFTRKIMVVVFCKSCETIYRYDDNKKEGN